MKRIGNYLINTNFIRLIEKTNDSVYIHLENSKYVFQCKTIQEIVELEKLLANWDMNIDDLYQNIDLMMLDIKTITPSQATKFIQAFKGTIPADIRAKQNYYGLLNMSNICKNCIEYDSQKKFCIKLQENVEDKDTCDTFDKFVITGYCNDCIHFYTDRCTLLEIDKKATDSCNKFEKLQKIKKIENIRTHCTGCIYSTNNNNRPCILNKEPDHKGNCTNKIK